MAYGFQKFRFATVRIQVRTPAAGSGYYQDIRVLADEWELMPPAEKQHFVDRAVARLLKVEWKVVEPEDGEKVGV